MELKQFVRNNMSLIYTLAIPLVASILPIVFASKPTYCAFVLIVMSGYWITECLPIAVTSILPVLMFPLFGILDSKTTSKIYFEDIIMLYFGGLIMALAIEHTNLHERIALRVIMLFGSNPKWLLLGIMIITGFLSVWISNVASASMMLPIVIEIAKQLIRTNKSLFIKKEKVKDLPMRNVNNMSSTAQLTTGVIEMDTETEDELEKGVKQVATTEEDIMQNPDAIKLIKGFCLSITYSASVGGTGSLVGTTPNLLLKGYYDKHYPNGGLNFLTYMLLAMPVAISMILLTWIWLTFLWLPRKYFFNFNFCKKSDDEESQPSNKEDELVNLMRRKYEGLGPFNWEQKSVGCFFILLVILWVTRDIYFVPGWGSLFQKGYVSDTTASILMVVLLVAWPKSNIFTGKKYQHLLDWKVINAEFPWYIILLGGGGLALAEGFEKSELSKYIGKLLTQVVPESSNLTLLIIMIFAQVGTEFTSNTSMESILLPVVDALANKNGINPSFLLLPLTISVSLAFLLPVATPTNAVVFASGYIKIKDMVISGMLLKLLGIVVVMVVANTWLGVMFKDPRSLAAAATVTPDDLNVLANNFTTQALFMH